MPSPHSIIAPLLLEELDALLDDELDELLEDDALDALEALDDELDAPDELLEDEPEELPVEEALDELVDEEPSKLDILVGSMAPSVSNAQASAMTLRARANETMVQMVNERD